MPITWNNYKKPIQPYQQPLVSVFNHIKESRNMQFNVSVLIQVTVNTCVNDSLLTGSQPSSLQHEEADKISNKFTFDKKYKKIPQIVGILSTLIIAANNGIQVWQNLDNNDSMKYPFEYYGVEKVSPVNGNRIS